MKLKLKVASAGQGCVFRYSGLFTNEEEIKTDGVYDFTKCARLIRAASDEGWICTSSNDGRNATFTAVSFAFNLCELCDKMMRDAEESRKDDARAPHREINSASDRRASKKVDRGDCSFVTVEVKEAWPVRIRVGYNLAKGGDMQREWCRDVALLCAEIACGMAEASPGKIKVVEGAGCDGMIARAEEIAAENKAEKARRALVESRRECERRVNGYCSPMDAGCPFYQRGECHWKE